MIEWNEKLSTGISIIDEEHKKFINIINSTVVATQDEKNPEKIENVLHEMIDFAWDHFKTEEFYMKEFNYSEYQGHKEEHLDFIHRTISYFDRAAKGNYNMANEILEYLKQWLANHVQITDQKYSECFIKNGLK
jgi:hemerythrin